MVNKGNGSNQPKNCSEIGFNNLGEKFKSQLNVKSIADYKKFPRGILNACVAGYESKLHKPEAMASPNNRKNKPFGFTFSSYVFRNRYQEKSFKEMSQWRPGHKSIFLFGTVGAGKTHLLKALHDLILFSKHFKNKKLKYTLSTQLASDLADYKTPDFSEPTWGLREGNKSECTFHTAKNIDVLFIEDLGQENTTEHFKSKLYEIIDHRINLKMPTFIDSNLTKEKLVKVYGGGLADRLINSFNSVECSSEKSGREIFGEAN